MPGIKPPPTHFYRAKQTPTCGKRYQRKVTSNPSEVTCQGCQATLVEQALTQPRYSMGVDLGYSDASHVVLAGKVHNQLEVLTTTLAPPPKP